MIQTRHQVPEEVMTDEQILVLQVPITDHAAIREYVDAPYSVLEMKRVDDVARCVGPAAPDDPEAPRG